MGLDSGAKTPIKSYHYEYTKRLDQRVDPGGRGQGGSSEILLRGIPPEVVEEAPVPRRIEASAAEEP